MKKLILILTLLFLFIVYAVMVYNIVYDVTEWMSARERSLKDFFYFKKEDFVALALILISAAGLFIKEKIGWILTTQLFYSLMGASFTIITTLHHYKIKVTGLSSIIVGGLLLLPLIAMNSLALKSFYRLDKTSNMLVNNVIAISIAIIGGLLMW